MLELMIPSQRSTWALDLLIIEHLFAHWKNLRLATRLRRGSSMRCELRSRVELGTYISDLRLDT